MSTCDMKFLKIGYMFFVIENNMVIYKSHIFQYILMILALNSFLFIFEVIHFN